MSYRTYRELTINGYLLKGRDIVEYCRKSEFPHIRNVGRFIADWLSPSPVIQVQTSGSTGKPKIIEVEKESMLKSAAATAKFFNFKKGQSALLCLPMDYIAGKMMVVRALFSKLNLICLEPDNAPLAKTSKDSRIDFVPMTPMQLKGTTDTYDIRKILLGGGPVSMETEKVFQSLKAEIYHGYGMAETLSHIALRKVNGLKKSNIYKALPEVVFKKDFRGCLVIHVPFLKYPVVTNDVVDILDQQSFIWKGRIDNVVNSGGIKLIPEEIERKLYPIICQNFFVAGIPDKTLGEKLCLFIEGDSYEGNTLHFLHKKFFDLLDKYEKPREIFFVKKFNTTNSGKVQRERTIKSIGIL